MFRPVPQSTLFRWVPLRLIGSVLLILAFAVSVMLLVSLEHEKFVVHGLTAGKTPPSEFFHALWQSRRDFIGLTVLLFLLSAIGIAAVTTFIHYQNTRRTLEEVKGLARHILQSIPTGVLTIGHDGVITAVNPAAESVLKWSSLELLGHRYETVFGEGDLVRRVLDAALRRHDHASHEDLVYEETGGARRTIRVSTADLTDDDGAPAGVILQAQDVTEWLGLEQRLRNAEKLSALHTLSAGVAHELRNPLSAVDLNLQLLEEELAESRNLSPQVRQYLQILNGESRRLSGILDNFMKFARPRAVRPQAVDVTAVVQHLVSLLRHDAEDKGIRLEAVVPDRLAGAWGDETRISQVLLNIVVNAFQAMPGGGTCRLTAAEVETGGEPWIRITVQDTGVGIAPRELPRVFEPFYTTKPSGSGLGLSIAYRIVQDHGGSIEVTSTPGEGTLVTILLPVASRPPASAEAPA